MKLHRCAVKIAGESGQGISSVGEILANAVKENGLKAFEYREYPSLIRGGFATSQIDISDKLIKSSRKKCDLLVCMSRVSLHEYLDSVEQGGTIIHALSKVKFNETEQAYLENNNIDVHFVDAFEKAERIGGNKIFANLILLGIIWYKLNLDFEVMKAAVIKKLGDKKQFLDKNLESLKFGFDMHLPGLETFDLPFYPDQDWVDSILIKGNEALALGGIHAGTRMFCGYPMTPATSIMGKLSKTYHDTGIVVKQAEDEITAAQMTIGASFMGTRAFTATSGGGFDLMTESVSLAGMTETPFVCVIAQRPGPATGLPTWTGAGDLNLAIYAGHGEFPRCVIAASGAESSFEAIQHALNIAEQYQMVVIVLTEKQIAESMYNISDLKSDIPIKRGLIKEHEATNMKPTDRFKETETGVSPRWLPGQSDAAYLANSDEHVADGTLTEEALPAQKMFEKRMRKQESLLKQLPEPELYGNHEPTKVIVGWGSTKATVLDCLEVMDEAEVENVAYLHFEYIFPLRTEKLKWLKSKGVQFYLMEANYNGQLGQLIKQNTDIDFTNSFLKYNGRPFFVDETVDFILDITK